VLPIGKLEKRATGSDAGSGRTNVPKSTAPSGRTSGIEETVEKFGDQYPRQKDKMISWGELQIQLIQDFVAEIESGGTPGENG
jgi:hypothetical protein